jgi:hypothetical protein
MSSEDIQCHQDSQSSQSQSQLQQEPSQMTNMSLSSSSSSSPESQPSESASATAGGSSSSAASAVPIAAAASSFVVNEENLRPNTPTNSSRPYNELMWRDFPRLQGHSANNSPLFATHICRCVVTPGDPPCNTPLKLARRAVKADATTTAAPGTWQLGAAKKHLTKVHPESPVGKAILDRKAVKNVSLGNDLSQQHEQMNGSSKRSVTETGAAAGLKSSLVQQFVFASHILPFSHATDGPFKETVNSAVHYGAVMRGATEEEAAAIVAGIPKVSIPALKQGIEAEKATSEVHVQLFLEEKFAEAGGNPFGQLQSDGGQLHDHVKYNAIGFQSTALEFAGQNFIIAIGVPEAPDGTAKAIAELMTDTIYSLSSFNPDEIASVHVTDCAPAALAIAKHMNLESEECVMHNSSSTSKYSTGEKTRSVKGVKQHPFVEFQAMQTQMDKIITCFVHSSGKREDLKAISESLESSRKRLEAGVNVTRFETKHSKIISILEHFKGLQVYAVQVCIVLLILTITPILSLILLFLPSSPSLFLFVF